MSENNEKNIENKKFNFPQNNKGFKRLLKNRKKERTCN